MHWWPELAIEVRYVPEWKRAPAVYLRDSELRPVGDRPLSGSVPGAWPTVESGLVRSAPPPK